jgi:hypothetical protein
MDGARAASATTRSTSSTDGCAKRVLSVDVMTSPIPARTELLLTLPGGDGDLIVSARNDLGDESLHLFGAPGYTRGQFSLRGEDTNSDHGVSRPFRPPRVVVTLRTTSYRYRQATRISRYHRRTAYRSSSCGAAHRGWICRNRSGNGMTAPHPNCPPDVFGSPTTDGLSHRSPTPSVARRTGPTRSLTRIDVSSPSSDLNPADNCTDEFVDPSRRRRW